MFETSHEFTTEFHLLTSLPARSLFERISLGCLYKYITALPTPLDFNESDDIGGNCEVNNVKFIRASSHIITGMMAKGDWINLVTTSMKMI